MQSLDTVRKVAALSRLDLTQGLDPEEGQAKLELFSRQFDDIVALMDTLGQVDTEGVEPLYWPLHAPESAPRPDVEARHNTREELLANSPEQDGRFFIVPRIV